MWSKHEHEIPRSQFEQRIERVREFAIGEMIRIGDEAAQRFGSEILGGRIGHGQGLDYSERPFLLAGSTETLKPGHVFVLHVCLGLAGANILVNPIADLCHVTEDPVEVLTRFPRELFHA